jgi:hypothetical protein
LQQEKTTMTLTQFAACCRQYGVNFRVVFTDSKSYVFIKGNPRKLQGSPVQLAITGRFHPNSRVVSINGVEGMGIYYELESLT